jgi:hypothetical protein
MRANRAVKALAVFGAEARREELIVGVPDAEVSAQPDSTLPQKWGH